MAVWNRWCLHLTSFSFASSSPSSFVFIHLGTHARTFQIRRLHASTHSLDCDVPKQTTTTDRNWPPQALALPREFLPLEYRLLLCLPTDYRFLASTSLLRFEVNAQDGLIDYAPFFTQNLTNRAECVLLSPLPGLRMPTAPAKAVVLDTFSRAS
eukprot:2776258-Pleurochrysis_carterae.AAC.2